jgi:hypothetical protein
MKTLLYVILIFTTIFLGVVQAQEVVINIDSNPRGVVWVRITDENVSGLTSTTLRTPFKMHITQGEGSGISISNWTNFKCDDINIVISVDPFYIHLEQSGYPIYKEKISFNESNKNIFVDFENFTKYEAVEDMKDAESVILQEKTKNFSLVEAETLLVQAQEVFATGDHIKSSELAKQAKSKAEAISRTAIESKNIINEVISIISQENAKDFNMAEAEALLSQAEHAFSTGDYARAEARAKQAEARALDIDGDGSPNSKDIVPAINNYFIYSGATIFLVGLAITLIMRQRIAGGRRRKEDAERRRRAMMKQDVIDMIDEATKGER